MTGREQPSGKRRQSLSVSVVLGIVLVPLAAFAASVLVDSEEPSETSSTTVPAAVAATQPEAVPSAVTASADDLAAACGDAGLVLVDAEADGSISEVQQAALDGLREVCDQQGMPLPGKPAPEPIVQTVVVAGNASSNAAAQPNDVFEVEDDDRDDDDRDDDHEEDDHDEDEDDD
ncbi:MAG TPA: hypothetical protein VLS86_07095 [Acidimicrobiia bacterium]|nr:hypothetical protein [Acidimicrobiia bacterium]